MKLLSVENVLDYPIINIKDEELLKKIKNGALINNIYNDKYIMFKYKHNIIAIYEIYSKNNSYMKPYIML